MTPRTIVHAFLGLVIAVSSYRLGLHFLAWHWDEAAGWGALLLSASTDLTLLWGLQSRPLPGRHTLNKDRRATV